MASGVTQARAREPETVPFEFTVFAAEPMRGIEFIPAPEADGVALTFYPTARSPRYTHRGGGPVLFVDAGTEDVVAEITPPPHCRRALLLFAAASAPEGDTPRYDVTMLEDDSANLPAGTLAILNASGMELEGMAGGHSFTLHSGLNAPVALDRSIEVRLQTRFRGRLYQSYSETIEPGRSGRALLILLPPYRAGSLEVQSRLLTD